MSSEFNNSFDTAYRGLTAYARAATSEDAEQVAADVSVFVAILTNIMTTAETRERQAIEALEREGVGP